jgi:hypothetical protein
MASAPERQGRFRPKADMELAMPSLALKEEENHEIEENGSLSRSSFVRTGLSSSIFFKTRFAKA